MIKVTAVSMALIGPCDQIIRSGSCHFGNYAKVRMIVTFSDRSFYDRRVLRLVRAFYPKSLTTSGYATDTMIQSDFQGQDERQKGMLGLMVIDTSLLNCYESSRFIGRLDDPEIVTMTYLHVTIIPLAVNSDIIHIVYCC